MQVNFNAHFAGRTPARRPICQDVPGDSSIRKMLDRANASLVEYRGRVSSMQKRIAELEKSVGSAPVQHRDSRLDEMENRIEELEDKCAEAEVALKIERERHFATRQELDKLQTMYNLLEADNEGLRTELEKARSKSKKRDKKREAQGGLGATAQVPSEEAAAVEAGNSPATCSI